MRIYDKISLATGKIVIFFITFLSCFYTVDLICKSIKPLLDKGLAWLLVNRSIVVLSSFSIIVCSALLIYLFSDNRYKTLFSKKNDIDDGCKAEETDAIK